MKRGTVGQDQLLAKLTKLVGAQLEGDDLAALNAAEDRIVDIEPAVYARLTGSAVGAVRLDEVFYVVLDCFAPTAGAEVKFRKMMAENYVDVPVDVEKMLAQQPWQLDEGQDRNFFGPYATEQEARNDATRLLIQEAQRHGELRGYVGFDDHLVLLLTGYHNCIVETNYEGTGNLRWFWDEDLLGAFSYYMQRAAKLADRIEDGSIDHPALKWPGRRDVVRAYILREAATTLVEQSRFGLRQFLGKAKRLDGWSSTQEGFTSIAETARLMGTDISKLGKPL